MKKAICSKHKKVGSQQYGYDKIKDEWYFFDCCCNCDVLERVA